MKPGVVLQGRYRLISPLGEGATGVVWRAEDERFAAPVAIKLMHPREAAREETRARFDAEPMTAARLRSPHVVQVFDAGIDPETGAPFIVMELLEGETLHERLLRTRTLAPSEVAKIVTHVGRALMRAHEQDIIHRDLKPANIFLVQNAEAELAKVLDFGVAKRSSDSSRRGPTLTGALIGTPSYMSPEQILSSKSLDHRTDLWSLGVIAAECLTGKLPFDSDNLPGLALLICHGNSTLPSRLGRVPPGFDAWFLRATQLEPSLRFESAAQMAEELRQVCAVVDTAPSRTLQLAAPGQASGAPAARLQLALVAESPDPHAAVVNWPLSGSDARSRLDTRGWSARSRGLVAGMLSIPLLFVAGWVLLAKMSRAPASMPADGSASIGSSEITPTASASATGSAGSELHPVPAPAAPVAQGPTISPLVTEAALPSSDAEPTIGQPTEPPPMVQSNAQSSERSPAPARAPGPGAAPAPAVSAEVKPAAPAGSEAKATASAGANAKPAAPAAGADAKPAAAPVAVAAAEGAPPAPVTSPAATKPIAKSAPEPLEAKVDCAQPFLTDAAGARRLKPGCSSNEEPGEVASGLDASAVRRTVRRYNPAVRQDCWEPALMTRAPGVPPYARLTASIEVDPSGRPRAVSVSDVAPDYPGLGRCVEASVRGWQFPAAPGSTITNVTLTFSAQ